MSLSYDQLVWWPGHELEGPLVQDQPHGDLQTELSALQRELGAGSWSSWGGHHDVTTAGWTPLQNPQTPQKLEPLGWWSTSLGKFRALILGRKFLNHWSHHRIRQGCVDDGPSGQLLGFETYRMRQVVWRWGLVVNESMVTRRLRGIESISMDLETVRLPGEDLFYCEELERWGVVVQGLRRRLHHLFVLFKPLCNPCRGRHGVLERRLASQGTLSGTSVSPKSNKEALAAGLVLAGLILYVPLKKWQLA